jgi:hypothetical protein
MHSRIVDRHVLGFCVFLRAKAISGLRAGDMRHESPLAPGKGGSGGATRPPTRTKYPADKSHEIVVWRAKSCKWRREWESNPRFSIIPRRTAETNPRDPSLQGFARARFDSGRRIVESGTASGVPVAGSLLFYFCRRIPRVILLVFVLVSAAIGDKSGFKFKWLWP